MEFLRIAGNIGLYAIVRPGPYICAELEFGGLPAWLLGDSTMKLRTLHAKFMQASRKYLSDLLRRLTPYQYSRGGPIIAFKVENEYQSYGADINYMKAIKQIFDDNGITELLFSSDDEHLLHRMDDKPIPDVISSVNFQSNPENALNILSNFQPAKARMVMEYWSGWFDHWGENHHTIGDNYFRDIVDRILSLNASINFYMFHGGTNFGFMNGANADYSSVSKQLILKPTVTSYDYNAPLSEHGEPSGKFYVIQRLAQKYGIRNGPMSRFSSVSRQPLGSVRAQKYLTLTDLLDSVLEPIGEAETPQYVEYICQSMINRRAPCKNPYYGFVVYRRSLENLKSNTFLEITGYLGDRMQVILDGILVGTITADFIENLGRVNFMHIDEQRKGFAGSVSRSYDGRRLVNRWKVYDLGLKPEVVAKMTSQDNAYLWKNIQPPFLPRQPAFYRFDFSLPGNFTDQFLNFQYWTKGVAFVNTRNLGRYWKKGPQRTLYLPAPYLRPNENTIIMFELEWAYQTIYLQDNPILD